MPAGTYYIGDLCYFMHDEWNEVCGLFFPPGAKHGVDGEFVLKDGRRFASFGTAHGDGEYLSNFRTRHCVDSGSIGCIRLEDIREDAGDAETLGAVVEFKEPFEVSTTANGTIKFGYVEIETSYIENEEEYE